ncbi:hypothetical protein H4R18_004058 [Coemansia javaensis]|uniref:Proteasome assembly chaperone 3 n=1 Tax=Coemansia javaensis TaxID=2761396 RepID=A0A9W8H6T4_9FUNG|nr:hypothetical protein H4R18_004058 [Coemansia javaensis]
MTASGGLLAPEPAPPAFPVRVELAAATINGTHTDVAAIGFSGCVVVLATQLASIGSLVSAVVSRLPDGAASAEHAATRLAGADVPVDVKFLLGSPAAASPAASLYQILAIDVAQRKRAQNPGDPRPVVLGVALDLPRAYKLPPGADAAAADDDPSAYAPVLRAVAELVDSCRVW